MTQATTSISSNYGIKRERNWQPGEVNKTDREAGWHLQSSSVTDAISEWSEPRLRERYDDSMDEGRKSSSASNQSLLIKVQKSLANW